MFVSPTRRRPPRQIDPRVLSTLAEQVRPISAARHQLLPVTPALAGLLPEPGLRRGSTIQVTAGAAGGSTTLALMLVSAAMAAGSWCAVVGQPDLGAVAASELALDLDHLVCVPWPGVQWGGSVAALIAGVDLVLLRPPPHARPHLTRRLVSRLRDQGAVLMVVGPPASWPEPCDVELCVDEARWIDAEPGGDCLRHREATITATGRRAAGRPRRQVLALPAGPQPLIPLASGGRHGTTALGAMS